MAKKYVNLREFFLTNCVNCPFLHLEKCEWGCDKNDKLPDSLYALLFGGLRRTTMRRCPVLYGEAEEIIRKAEK